MAQNVVCPYCGNSAHLVRGTDIYPHRLDLGEKYFYRCPNEPCDAYVGCHPPTSYNGYAVDQPLGRLANAQLRKAKFEAHNAFDRLWRQGFMARSHAYNRLSGYLRIPKESCHIGMFDVAKCEKTIKFAKRVLEEECLKRKSQLATVSTSSTPSEPNA